MNGTDGLMVNGSTKFATDDKYFETSFARYTDYAFILDTNQDNPNLTFSFQNITLTEDIKSQHKSLLIIEMYVLPLVAVIGLICNTLSNTVFRGRDLWQSPSSIFLSVLAVTDNIFLLSALFPWLPHIGFDTVNSSGWCQLIAYSTHVTSTLSALLITAFSMDGCLAVLFPFKSHVPVCNRHKAWVVIVVSTILSSVMYTFVFVTYGITKIDHYHDTPICTVTKYEKFTFYMDCINSLIVCVVPMVVILGSNIIAAFTLSHYHNKKSMTYKSLHVLEEIDYMIFQAIVALKLERITRMLHSVSAVFLALSLPRNSMKIYMGIQQIIDNQFVPSQDLIYWYKLSQILRSINFACNFFLYNLASQRFRTRLKALMKRKLDYICQSKLIKALKF